MTPTSEPEATLQTLAPQLQEFADAREWGPFHSPKNLASALIVEAGELLEHFQWLTEDQSRQLAPDKKQAVAHEMAAFMPYLPFHTASVAAPLGCMMLPACARAMGARMITTITTAAA